MRSKEIYDELLKSLANEELPDHIRQVLMMHCKMIASGSLPIFSESPDRNPHLTFTSPGSLCLLPRNWVEKSLSKSVFEFFYLPIGTSLRGSMNRAGELSFSIESPGCVGPVDIQLSSEESDIERHLFRPSSLPSESRRGLLVGPNDPMFTGERDSDIAGRIRPRFDPIGPGHIGEPDDDHFPPPPFGVPGVGRGRRNPLRGPNRDLFM